MKILNLYCGIGGNRKLWGNEHEITAIENNPEIAKVYQDFFPNDKVIITDAHKYLLEHFKEFDFIWSSPPCPSHSKLRKSHKKIVFPDMKLYQEIVILKHFFKGKWVVENVEPYYNPLIKPESKIDRHIFWSNFNILKFKVRPYKSDVSRMTKEDLSKIKNINLDDYKINDKRLLLRNAVNPKFGLHVFNCAFKEKQEVLK